MIASVRGDVLDIAWTTSSSKRLGWTLATLAVYDRLRMREQLQLISKGIESRCGTTDHILLSGPPGLGKTSRR